MDLITPEIGLFFWQTVVFLVLLFLMAKFAWKPILSSIRNREQSINDALASAENARKEMQNLRSDNEQLMKEARAERDAILREARELKEKVIADASEEAKVKADKIVADAKRSIELEKQSAMAELKNHVAELSVEIAEKIVRKELSGKNEQHQMIEKMIGDAKLN
ncbi:ATP synthase F0 subcomplex B subunit [Christiangramia gaetbulicola]|uniref:ATP synthase subunit b n=1 Tax=Christiangramia gaetbulicola TaxID=703340 RepID=A0A2T6AMM6_9FLAO|nr:F0F1 ATP synthase subunit B [Christiangramia gaetbulicola]PTX45073.1 ATP synthase F0 subcomplex B subunit [Christiangramia gaetbulicola]